MLSLVLQYGRAILDCTRVIHLEPSNPTYYLRKVHTSTSLLLSYNYHTWQSQVENVHYTYHFLTTFSDFAMLYITSSINNVESSKLIFSISHLFAKSIPRWGLKH